MIRDLDDLFVVLEKFNITMEQFMLPYILFLDQREHGEGPLPCGGHAVAYIYRYSENIRAWPRASIQDLVDKGLLKDYNEDEGVYPDNLEVTDKFAEAVFATWSDFDQFWDAYPSFAENSEGATEEPIPLKASMRSDVRDLFEDHVQTKRDFKEVMETLKWAKQRDMVRMTIEKFLGSEYWKQLRELKREPSGVGTPVKY